MTTTLTLRLEHNQSVEDLTNGEARKPFEALADMLESLPPTAMLSAQIAEGETFGTVIDSCRAGNRVAQTMSGFVFSRHSRHFFQR